METGLGSSKLHRLDNRGAVRVFLVAALLVLLAGCGESTEDAFERGVEEGAAEVC